MAKKDHITTEICNVCGKSFEKAISSGAINCPDCVRNRKKALVRPYTKDTVFLVCKWNSEGMTVSALAELLSRSQDNIRKAWSKEGLSQNEKTETNNIPADGACNVPDRG